MILILIALIISGAIAGGLLVYATSNYESFFSFLAGMLLLVATGCASLFYVFAGWDWFASQYKADIINKEYGTNYSAKQVFFASDVIDTVRELDRKRIEVNGDLFRDEPDEPDGE